MARTIFSISEKSIRGHTWCWVLKLTSLDRTYPGWIPSGYLLCFYFHSLDVDLEKFSWEILPRLSSLDFFPSLLEKIEKIVWDRCLFSNFLYKSIAMLLNGFSTNRPEVWRHCYLNNLLWNIVVTVWWFFWLELVQSFAANVPCSLHENLEKIVRDRLLDLHFLYKRHSYALIVSLQSA